MNDQLLIFQEFSTPDGLRYLIWEVPQTEYLELLASYKVENPESDNNEAWGWALWHLIFRNHAKFVQATEQDASLFAANLRERRISARHMPDCGGGL